MDFSEVKAAAGTLLQLLPGDKGVVGNFHYDNTDNFSIAFRRSDGADARLCFYVTGAKIPDHFQMIDVSIEGICYAVEAKTITSHRLKRGVFPSWEFDWTDDGNLSFLRIDIDMRSFVLCRRSRNRTYELQKYGDSPMLADLPDSLNGHANLLNIPIPWVIDYEARVNELIKASGLAEFVEAVRARFS